MKQDMQRAGVALRVGLLGVSIGLICIGLFTTSVVGQIAVLSDLTHEFVVVPGGIYQGEIEVKNTSDEAVLVQVLQRDYLFYADGSTVRPDPGTIERSNAPWTTLYKPQLVLIAAGETETVGFQVVVPNDETLVGTYWSSLLVSPAIAENPDVSDEEAEDSVGMRIVVQYGIQIVTHIGDTGEQAINVFAAELTHHHEYGTPLLLVDVENTGERWVRLETWVEIFDASGEMVARVEGSRFRIYPGTSAQFRFDLSDLPPGAYKALVVFDNSRVDANIWGIQIDLNF